MSQAQIDQQVAAAAEAIAAADQARSLISNPLITQYWSAQEANLIERLISLPPEDDHGRYRLATAINAVRQLRAFLEKTAEIGAYAEAQLQQLEGLINGYQRN